MTDTERGTGTGFAPDWRSLRQVYAQVSLEAPRDRAHQEGLGAVITEYERQRQAAGYVVVRRETLQELVNRYGFLRDSKEYLEARAILAANPPQPDEEG
jgi:hypothetical protein